MVIYLGETKTKSIWRGHEAYWPPKFTFEQDCLKIQQTGSGQILMELILLCTANSITSSPWATFICFWALLLVLDPRCRPYKVSFPATFLKQLKPPLKSCFPNPFEGFTMNHIQDECACNLIIITIIIIIY